MALKEETLENLVSRYVSNNMVLSFGTSAESTRLAKKLALRAEEDNLDVSVVPTSNKIAEFLEDLGI